MRSFIIALLLAWPSVVSAAPVPSLYCAFTEPFANILVWPGSVRATHEQTFTTTNFAVTGTRLEPVIETRINNRPMKLSVHQDSGSDGMSDFVYPLTGKLSGWMMGTAQLEGGCVRFPHGSAPWQIVGLSQTQTLNVRQRPSLQGRVVGKLDANDQVWIVPGNTSGTWTRVAYAFMPNAETGDVRIVQGWVATRYLGPLNRA
jgi:uncharacterized membrane protein